MNKISENLFAKIRGRFPSVTLGDETGVVTDDPQMARYFDFDFQDDGKTLGKVSITINEESGVTVTFNNDFITNENDDVKNNWYSFLKELRVFSKKNMLNFDTRDITKSNLDKRDYAHLTKTSSGDNRMSETKMYGTSRTSYEDVGTARLVLKHNQPVNLEIPGSRTQHVHSIYIESDNGERYKYPYRHLNGARALARHVDGGGNLYDDFGKHIVGLSEELSKLRQFKTYINRSAVMAEGLKGYLNVVNERLETVKKECLKLQRETYYKDAVANYKQEVMEEVPEEVTNSWIDELTIRSFNEELKSVFPYIYKLINDSKKVDEIGPDRTDEILPVVGAVAGGLARGALAVGRGIGKAVVGGIAGSKKALAPDDDEEEIRQANPHYKGKKLKTGDNTKKDEGFDPDDFDDEVDVEWTGDDGEVTGGMLSYHATVDHENGTVTVDPKSLRGSVDQEQNAAKVDQELIDMQLKDDLKHFLEIAQDHADDMWSQRDNKYSQGEETEDHGSNVDEFLTKIANDNDSFELIDQGLRGKHGPEIEKALQDMYDQASHDHGLHPDDDHEEIYNRMQMDIEDAYGTSEELEPQAFDPVAEYEKALSYIVGEQENALTDGSDEDKAQAIEKINELMTQHFPAGENGANAIESLAGIIDDPKLQEMFRKVGQKNSDICVRPLVMKWIKAHAPDVSSQIDTGDMQGGEEVPTEARPLDHPEKGYFDPKILKKIVKQKGAERDKEKGDNKKPSEKLEELIKSYYDYTTNKFPKGETAVMTAVEKEFGERSLPYAERMIEKLFHGQDAEMERVKQLAGV